MSNHKVTLPGELLTAVEVLRISKLLQISRAHVVGCLYVVADWAKHYGASKIAWLKPEWIDDFTGQKGFGEALVSVGWLKYDQLGFAKLDRAHVVGCR